MYINSLRYKYTISYVDCKFINKIKKEKIYKLDTIKKEVFLSIVLLGNAKIQKV
jgi:hypothetical protein